LRVRLEGDDLASGVAGFVRQQDVKSRVGPNVKDSTLSPDQFDERLRGRIGPVGLDQVLARGGPAIWVVAHAREEAAPDRGDAPLPREEREVHAFERGPDDGDAT